MYRSPQGLMDRTGLGAPPARGALSEAGKNNAPMAHRLPADRCARRRGGLPLVSRSGFRRSGMSSRRPLTPNQLKRIKVIKETALEICCELNLLPIRDQMLARKYLDGRKK
jgi:hypothetical protein